jgi:hypothetical protein
VFYCGLHSAVHSKTPTPFSYSLIYNTKNNIFNINTFDYSKNHNIHKTNNTNFNFKNI